MYFYLETNTGRLYWYWFNMYGASIDLVRSTIRTSDSESSVATDGHATSPTVVSTFRQKFCQRDQVYVMLIFIPNLTGQIKGRAVIKIA